MNYKTTIAKVLIIGLGVFAATPAFALVAETEDTVGVQLPGEANVHASAQVDVSDDVEVNDNIQGDKNRGGSATSTLHREDSGENEDEGDIDVSHEDGVRATTTVSFPEQVQNRGQLRSFLNHLVKADDRISDVLVSSTTVATSYTMPAKFLWAIPSNLTANISVGSDGTVTITYPWYAFLYAKNSDALEAQLNTALATSSTNASLSANVEAHLLNTLFSVLRNSSNQ